MKTYTTERTEEGPFRADDPMDRLIAFYRANGYEVFERESDQPTPPGESVGLVRGESEASWWSSNMTELSNRIEVRRDPDAETITLRYRVDVTGQHLTDSDRQFWDREMQAAFDHLHNPSRTPRDLRHEETKRAERIRRRMLSYGIWGAVLTFLVILLVKLLTNV